MNRRSLIITAAIFLPLMITSFQNCASDNQVQDTKSNSSSAANPGPSPAPAPVSTPPPAPIPVVYKACSFYLTSGSNWTVPSDWNSGSNTIEAVGNGSDAGGNVRAGGGGGAYSKSVNVVLIPGSVVAYNLAHVPITLSAGNSSGDVYFCNSSKEKCTSLTDPAVVVSAQGGRGSTNGYNLDSTGGLGGEASAGIATGPGAVKYSGGNGGPCGGNNPDACNAYPGGGGGAAGPNGNGGNGTDAGGAANAGAAAGGAGGVFPNQTPGGAGNVAFPFGDTIHGVGAGGGGGGYLSAGGAGGNYGGGAGGGGYSYYNNTPGGGGLIVIKYQGTTCL